MFSVNQIVAHLIGDYFLQSDWMAVNKYHDKKAAFIHAFSYTIPFTFLTLNIPALLFIMITHFLIDHYKLPRYAVWIKNFIGPSGYPLKNMKDNGFNKECPTPEHIQSLIFIIMDNTLHILCNGVAIGFIATLF